MGAAEERPPKLVSTCDLRQSSNSSFRWKMASVPLVFCAVQLHRFNALCCYWVKCCCVNVSWKHLSHFKVLKWKGRNKNMKENSRGGAYKVKPKVYVYVYIHIFIPISKWPCVFLTVPLYILRITVCIKMPIYSILSLPFKNCESQQKCYKNI